MFFKTNYFVLCFLIRNFGIAELTCHSEMKRKATFSFAFLSFFRNFAIKDGELTPSRQKNELILLFCSRLFVTLQAIYASVTKSI